MASRSRRSPAGSPIDPETGVVKNYNAAYFRPSEPVRDDGASRRADPPTAGPLAGRLAGGRPARLSGEASSRPSGGRAVDPAAPRRRSAAARRRRTSPTYPWSGLARSFENIGDPWRLPPAAGRRRARLVLWPARNSTPIAPSDALVELEGGIAPSSTPSASAITWSGWPAVAGRACRGRGSASMRRCGASTRPSAYGAWASRSSTFRPRRRHRRWRRIRPRPG